MPRHHCVAGPEGKSINVPFTAEEEAERDREEAEWAAEQQRTAYSKARVAEYPSIGEQLDMIWHDMDEGAVEGIHGEWYAKIKAIKEKHPKP